jgi:hypothetical protein
MYLLTEIFDIETDIHDFLLSIVRVLNEEAGSYLIYCPPIKSELLLNSPVNIIISLLLLLVLSEVFLKDSFTKEGIMDLFLLLKLVNPDLGCVSILVDLFANAHNTE